MKILGLDPSTKTGWVMLDTDGPVKSGEIEVTSRGMKRVRSIQKNLKYLMHVLKPDFVMIEGYAFGNRHTLVTLVEIGTAIRLALHDDDMLYVDVPPSVLKKFVTGKGNAKKKDMMLEVGRRWGFQGTDNECDAFGLAALGMTMNDAHGSGKELPESVQGWLKKSGLKLVDIFGRTRV